MKGWHVDCSENQRIESIARSKDEVIIRMLNDLWLCITVWLINLECTQIIEGGSNLCKWALCYGRQVFKRAAKGCNQLGSCHPFPRLLKLQVILLNFWESLIVPFHNRKKGSASLSTFQCLTSDCPILDTFSFWRHTSRLAYLDLQGNCSYAIVS